MVPDPPSLSRRKVLGGVATAATLGGTVAVGATAPTALPDVVTDEATKHYPTPPEVSTLWQPTVTEAHAREAVDRLAATVSAARDRWDRLDTDDHFTGAGGWLENARAELRRGNYAESLFDARYGMQFAAEQLGEARARLGEADLPGLADRTDALLDRTTRVSDDLDPYPVVDPGRDLAWYYRIERELARARLHLSWDRDAVRDGRDDTGGFRPYEVGGIVAGVRQGALAVRAAERFRDLLFDSLESERTAYADHLAAVTAEFEGAVEGFPSREAVRAEYIPDAYDDDGEVTPYEFAHSRILRWCIDYDHRFTADEADLPVRRAVELSKALAGRRAHAVAVENLVVERGDESFDSGHTLAEKRRARSAYRSVVGDAPPPLLTRQVSRAVEDLQVAKVGFAGSYQRPLWRERLKAYLYALVGRAKLLEYPPLYERIGDTTLS